MILSLYHNRNKMKNYQELSQKYFKKEDRVEDAADALMIIMSNLSDIQGQIVNDFDPDLVADRLNDLKEFVSDVKRLEWQLQ
jgi:hypothetical protein